MKNILCFGDSNTWGYTPGTGERYAQDVRWTGVLQRELGDHYRVIEDGQNARTSVYEDMWSPWRCGKDALPGTLIAQKPLDLLILSLGTNDLLRQGLARPVLTAEDILSHFSYLLPRAQAAQADCTRWRLVRCPAAPEKQAPKAQPEPESAPADPAPDEAPSASVSEISPEKKVDTGRDSGYIELLDASGRWSEQERTLLKALVPGPATVETLIAATGSSAGLVAATLTMLAVAGAVRELPGGRFQLVPEELA